MLEEEIESPLSLATQDTDLSNVPPSQPLSNSESVLSTISDSTTRTTRAARTPNKDFSTPSISTITTKADAPITTTSSQSFILNEESLRRLQEEDDKGHLSKFQYFSRFLSNDLYTDFEKQILKLKPSDCPVIQKFSNLETFPLENHPRLDSITLSTIYSDHPLREFHKRSVKKLSNIDSQGLQNAQQQLDKIEELPLMFFLHGLGGQLSQLEAIIQEFRNCADIFGIDLPGFGNSKPQLRNKLKFNRLSDFQIEDIEKLDDCLNKMAWEDFQTDSIVEIIYQVLNYKFPNRRLIIISHSMGTHLTLKLINKFPKDRIESICLLAPAKLQSTQLPFPIKFFLGTCNYFPRLFDFYRMTDRSGGLYSHSVDSYIYPEEDDIFKRLTQFRWNLDTDSNIFLKYIYGFSPITETELLEAASKINNSKEACKILICNGDNDKLTPFKNSENIHSILIENGFQCKLDKIINANHSLFLDKPHYLSAVIYQFIEELHLNIDCTWVLQVKATLSGDKWGLKNKEKWDKVVTLSKPLINSNSPTKPKSPLLGMKTLTQTDQTHNPKQFELDHPEVYAIVDIGSNTPSYDPTDLSRVKYLKYKTESKVIPDNISIIKFISFVDKLVQSRTSKDQYVVVHCHYGQNRTGFLICCYLVEKLGWSVKESLDAFSKGKPPGIKHEHFKNALYLRYGES